MRKRQAWVANHPGVDVMLVGADTTAQFYSAWRPSTPGMPRNCTAGTQLHPCDVINDYTAAAICVRPARAGPFQHD